jgi:hypothetical protein
MTRVLVCLLLIACPGLAQRPPASEKRTVENPVAVARRFLPPNCQTATLYTFDFDAGRVSRRWPAVLTGHIVGPNTKDVVFAYYCPPGNVIQKTLFLDLLHRTPHGYEKDYEISYRTQVLLIPKAIRVLHLRGLSSDAVAVIHGIGATLGGQLDVFLWSNLWGWQDIFPRNGGTGYTYFFPRKTGLDVALSTANHPGLAVSPPPVWFRWNGKEFEKISAPPGSSKWPLPN